MALKFLDSPGRWPGRARVLALVCCAGPLGRVVTGNILSEVTALSGRAARAEPRWPGLLAGGRQGPSESVARRSRHVRWVEWRVGPMCRADCGQWWPAKLFFQPDCPKSVSAPRGEMSGMVGQGHRLGHGFPSRPGTSPPKATEGLFKLEAGFAMTAHSAGCED